MKEFPDESVKSGGDRRESIVRAAVGTLSRYGFRGATTRRIARDARVSEALLYKHFRSKSELLDAVLDHLVETFRAPCRSQTEFPCCSDRELLIWYARHLLAKAQRNPEEVRILLYAGLQGHRLAGEYQERQEQSALQELAARIQLGQEQGRYRKMSPIVAAHCFLSMIRSQVLKLVIFDKKFCLEDDVSWPEMFVEIFLRGIS